MRSSTDRLRRNWLNAGQPKPALARTAAELEQRVEERTAALHQAMDARQRLEQEAQRVQHFVLLGRLAAGVSHEIRNPLGAVFLHVDLLAEKLRDHAPESAELVADMLAEIRTQLGRRRRSFPSKIFLHIPTVPSPIVTQPLLESIHGPQECSAFLL